MLKYVFHYVSDWSNKQVSLPISLAKSKSQLKIQVLHMGALKLYQISESQGCCSKLGHLEIYRGILGIPLSPESCWIVKGLWCPLWYIGAPSFLDAPKGFPCADEMQSPMSRDMWLGWQNPFVSKQCPQITLIMTHSENGNLWNWPPPKYFLT